MAFSMFSMTTKYFADSVECCPGQNFLACGNYQLEENTSKPDEETAAVSSRCGCIYLMERVGEVMEVRQQIETRGILDQKWFNERTLGAVTSVGELDVYELSADIPELTLKTKLKIENDDCSDLIALSLDYANDSVIVSDSKGNISLVKKCGNDLELVDTFTGHDFEAWTCAFDVNDPNVFYSGGDDSVCNVFDVRHGTGPTLKNTKSHGAGVTALRTLPSKSNTLITGSYDEVLRLFDTRSFKQPLHELNLRGGIWRIKSHPMDSSLLLCACMYENFSVVSMLNDDTGFCLQCEFKEHHSICYGADWLSTPNQDGDNYYFATCSFYDKKFSLNCYARHPKINLMIMKI